VAIVCQPHCFCGRITNNHYQAQALSDLEGIILREPLVPNKDEAIRQDTLGEKPKSKEEIGQYCVESHRYDLRKRVRLDYVSKALHNVIPATLKDDWVKSSQMRLREKGEPLDVEKGLTYTRTKEDQLHLHKYDDSEVVNIISRLIIAVLGSAAMLAPILIMTDLHKQKSRVITVSVSVLIFGLVLSFGSRPSNQEILAASAAYTAVLVVYVGTAS
jgi:hypothetical protein